MLRTLRSDILNPNLDVKMFIKGVQTESIFSVPFVPNKKMLWLAIKTLTWRYELKKVWTADITVKTTTF